MALRENDHSLHDPELSVGSQDGFSVVTVSGDLDIACVPVLREQLLELLGPHASRLVIELSGVTFCDASGLDVLVGVERRARLLDGVLRLAAPASPVTAVLRLTGLDRHFQVFDTVPAAVRAPVGPDDSDVTAARPQIPSQAGAPAAHRPLPPRGPVTADHGEVHEAVAAVLAESEAWRAADPRGQLTRPLRALAGAHVSADRPALLEAARSLLAGLLRHPLTHSPPVAATATELRRALGSGLHQPPADGPASGRSPSGPTALASA
jgi:anti-sigma B factor antagonist